MLQLSNNPQLIKYVVCVINFFTSWTEMFSAQKAKVDVFFLIYSLFASVLLSAANGRCILPLDRRLIAQTLKKTTMQSKSVSS